jgi:ribosomal protein S18 acetylase RimI-like enzyme
MPDEVYVDGVAVDPSCRGQRIGTGLIHALERWALDRGFSLISLEVVDANPRARRLYQRIGFDVVREQTVWPIGSVFGFQSSAKMVKPLFADD